MKTSLILDLAGNLQAKARQNGQELDAMSRRGQAALRGLQGAGKMAAAGIDKIGNRYTALLSGGALAMSAKKVMDSSMSYTRLGIQAGLTSEQVKGLKQQIIDTAQAPDIRLDPEGMKAGVAEILSATGDLKFAQDNLRNVGLAMQATGASGEDVGRLFGKFREQGMSVQDIGRVMDTLITQGRQGSMSFDQFAGSLGPLITQYSNLGHTGPQAMAELGAALQVIRKGTDTAGEAVGVMETVMDRLMDKEVKAGLKNRGVKLVDEKGNKRAIGAILRDIAQVAGEGGKNLEALPERLRELFGGKLSKNLAGLIAGFDQLDALTAAQGEGTMLRDSARAASEASSAVNNLRAAWEQFADAKLSGPVQALADALNSLGSEKTQKALDVAAKVALVGGGLVAARKGYQAYNGIRNMFGGGGAKGAAGQTLNALGGVAGAPVPVQVVNWGAAPTGMGGAEALPGGGTVAAGQKRLSAGQAARSAAKGAGLMAVANGALQAVQALSDDSLSKSEKIGAVAEAGGQAAGGWAGATAGAAIGTLVLPGIGTAIGGVLGGLLGALGGGKLAQAAAAKFTTEGDGQEKVVGALDEVSQAIKESPNKNEIRIVVDGGTARLAGHDGPAQLEVYSGMGGFGGW